MGVDQGVCVNPSCVALLDPQPLTRPAPDHAELIATTARRDGL